jgi:hypothetical protein
MNAARKPPPIDPPEDDAARDTLPPPEDDAARNLRLLLEMLVEYENDNARLKRENWRLTAAQVERDKPNWTTVKIAAAKAGCHEETARQWASDAIKAGRSNEATKTPGIGVRINATALAAAFRKRKK